VTGVAPASGPETTGTPIVITGTHLSGTTAVDVGGACSGVAVVDDTTVNATTPADVDAGTHPVRVTTPRGVVTGPDFEYEP
jgi:IPT/TIG domain